jgi:hypothetical protein
VCYPIPAWIVILTARPPDRSLSTYGGQSAGVAWDLRTWQSLHNPTVINETAVISQCEKSSTDHTYPLVTLPCECTGDGLVPFFRPHRAVGCRLCGVRHAWTGVQRGTARAPRVVQRCDVRLCRSPIHVVCNIPSTTGQSPTSVSRSNLKPDRAGEVGQRSQGHRTYGLVSWCGV